MNFWKSYLKNIYEEIYMNLDFVSNDNSTLILTLIQ